MKSIPALLTALSLALPVAASAQDKGASSGAPGPSSQMHREMMKGAKESMAMKPSGDVDQDFVNMMRHHHETGIRMAQHEVRNGKDPEVRALAEKILKGQQQEANELERLANSGGGAGSSGRTGHGTSHSK